MKGMFLLILDSKNDLSSYPFSIYKGWSAFPHPVSHKISIWAPNADLQPVVPAVEALDS